MDRSRKVEQVRWISGLFESGMVVVVRNGGLTVAELEVLRGDLRAAGAGIKVIKNRLAKIAIADGPAAGLSGHFRGPVAVAFSDDPVSAPKVLKKFADSNEKLAILGGAMGGEVFDEAGVRALASMPSREELLASLVLTIGASASSLAGALAAPASDTAGILETLEEREAA